MFSKTTPATTTDLTSDGHSEAATAVSAPRRRRPSSRSRLLAGVAAVALFAAACGSDDASTEAADDEVTTTTETADDMTDDMADDMTDEDMSDDMADDEMADDEMAGGDMMGAFGPGCEAVPLDGEGSFAGMADDPAATAASANPLLSTLVTAVGEAGLVDTLNSDGPFTIFAPTNDAFAAIDPAVLDAVLADTDLLTTVLTYHVIGGESLGADDLADGSFVTVQGDEVTVGADGTMINDATAICSNVPVANGTVHIVDQVLLPQDAIDAITAMS